MRYCAARKLGVGSVIVGIMVVALASGGVVFAAETAGQPGGMSVKIPETAQEHLAMAASYREKVKTYLQEVETHQQMLEAYRYKVVATPKSIYENPWLKKMRKHCEAYIADARRLAAAAQKFADYHELRGKELQGQ